MVNIIGGLELLRYGSRPQFSDKITNCESKDLFSVRDEASRSSPPVSHHDHNPALQLASSPCSIVDTPYPFPGRRSRPRTFITMIAQAWKKNPNPSSFAVLQDKETKLEGHRLLISINCLVKSILYYISSPIWTCVGITILPSMEEYRNAWIELLQVLINNIRVSPRYVFFLTLLPKAIAHDLKSILDNFRRDLTKGRKFTLQNGWRRLWRSPKLNFSEIERGHKDWAFKEAYDASKYTERILFIGLSNIQYFSVLLSRRPDIHNGNKDNSMVELPLSIQVKRVKDALGSLNTARNILGRSLQIGCPSTRDLVSSQENSAYSSDSLTSQQASAASIDTVASTGKFGSSKL